MKTSSRAELPMPVSTFERRRWTPILILLLLAGSARAQESTRVEPTAEAVLLEATADYRPPVGRYRPAQDGGLPVLELSLQDAVELALRHNLQIRIAASVPEIQEEQIRFARSQFDPTLIFNVPQAFQRSTQPTGSAIGGAEVLTQENITAGFQVQAQTSFGTAWSLTGSGTRTVSNNEFSTFNPQFRTSLGLSVRQPLLRNFGDVNKQQIRVSQNNFSASRETFRLQLQQQIFGVVQAYWQLVQAYRSVEIAQQSLDLAEEQDRRNNAMVRIGVLAAVDVIQTERQVADARLSLIQNQINLQNQHDQLRRTLNFDAFVPEGWAVEIVPTSDPVTEAPDIEMEAAVAEALEKNPNIRADRINHQTSRINLDASRNLLMPQIDLIGNVTTSGLGGDQIFRSGDVFGNPVVSEVQEGGLGDSFAQLFSGDFRNWSVGIQVSFPIRNDSARAQHAQATIQERQTGLQIADRELAIRLAVQQATRNVEGGTQQVAAAQNAVNLATRQYNAELQRFQNGTSSTFTVLNFQQLLTASRQRDLNALIGLNLALANFEFSKGTLLELFGVVLEDAGAGGPMLQTQPGSSSALPAAAGSVVPMAQR